MSEFTAVVTGGNKGIGADLAEKLLGQGYTVVSVARSGPDKVHPNLHSVEADLARSGSRFGRGQDHTGRV